MALKCEVNIIRANGEISLVNGGSSTPFGSIESISCPLLFSFDSRIFVFFSICCAIRRKGLQTIKIRKQMRKTINPITDNLIILSVSNQENILPIWLSCSSVTTMFEKDFVSVSLVVFLPDHLRYSVFPCLLYHGTDDF